MNNSLGQCAYEVAQYEADHSDAGYTGDVDNRSQQVDKFLAVAGHLPKNANTAGAPWCGIFVYYCYSKAASDNGRTNPLDDHVYSAHRLRNWALKHPNWVVWQQGSSRKARLAPGDIFVTSSVHHIGMVGFAPDIPTANFISVEGNQTHPGQKVKQNGIQSKVRGLDSCSIIIRVP